MVSSVSTTMTGRASSPMRLAIACILAPLARGGENSSYVFACDLPRVRWSADRAPLCVPTRPYVIEFEHARNAPFAARAARGALTAAAGDAVVRVTSSNAHSQNGEELPLRAYGQQPVQ